MTATRRPLVPTRRAVVLFVALAVLMASVLAGPAGAVATTPTQADTSTTLPPGGVTATQADDDEGPGPNAGGTTGLVVLIVVMGIIGGGATILYLRHRPR